MTLPDPVPGTAVAPPRVATVRERLTTPVRQSPIALFFIAARFVRRIGLFNIGAAVVFAVTGRFSAVLWTAVTVGAITLLVFSALSWWRFRFAVVGDDLVVTSGVLSVERLVIPLERVQSVSIDQRLLHRVVGLVSVSVDTAGSAGAEFEIAAIDAPTAEALRLVAADARATAPPVAAHTSPDAVPASPVVDEHVLVRRSFRELALVGVTRLPWAGLAVLAPIVALGDEFGSLLGLGDRIERVVEGGLERTGGSAGAVAVTVLVVVAVAAVLGALLQLVREVVTNWDLTLLRTPTGLRRTAGLLNRTSRSTTVRRVQAITTDDTPPQRWLGFTTLTLKTFGDNDVGVPGSKRADVDLVRRLVFGRTAPPTLDRRISHWFVFLAVRNRLVASLIVAALAWSRFGWWAALVLLAVPLRWLVAERQWRRRRWGVGADHVAEQYGLVTRHTTEAPLRKAQVVTLTQSFFERRRGLATVRLQTADGFLAVPLIDHDTATAVRDRALIAVETDRRPAL